MQPLRQVAGRTAPAFRPRGPNHLRPRPHEAHHILLTNVPRTATPADIRRAISQADVLGVSDIALDYKYFKPAERAILTLLSPSYLAHNLAALQHLTISGLPVFSQEYVPEPRQEQANRRMRGQEGRTQAAFRGALNGDGPSAGVTNNGMNVIIGGLPAKTTVDELTGLLDDFDIARSDKGLPQIQKISIPHGVFVLTAKFLVTLNSVAEAHRLVRKMHATYHRSDLLLSAKIIH